MKFKKNIIILILSYYDETYRMLENGLRETWVNHNNDDVQIFFYYGGNVELIDEDKIFINYPEGIENIGHKTIRAFEILLENFEFDYIFRTNSSSYVNIDGLIKYLEDKPKNNFYNGIIGNHNNIKYASGCGYFLSKDVVKKIVDNKNSWSHNINDDTALGELLSKIEIFPTSAPRLDISILPLPADNLIFSNFHFRCKTFVDRNNDIKIMKELNKKFNLK